MSKRMAWLALAGVLAVPAASWSASLDGSKPFLCALGRAVECDEDGDCEEGSPDDVNLPDFIWVDVPAKALREHGGERKTEILNHLRRDGQLILQGVQDRAWSVSISEQTGRFTATSTADGVAFVLFGACTIP